MRHPVAGGPLRQKYVSFKRVDRLMMERGQSRDGGAEKMTRRKTDELGSM